MSCIECLKRFSIFEVGQQLQPDCDLGKGVEDLSILIPGCGSRRLSHTDWLGKILEKSWKNPGKIGIFSNSPLSFSYEYIKSTINQFKGLIAKII